MPSPLVALVAFIVFGCAASLLARWFQRGYFDLQRTKTCALLVISLALVCYVNSFSNGFVWDDTPLIVENPSIRNWHHWMRAFTTDLYNNPVTQSFYYRPLQSLSYRLDYSLWGIYPDGYHILNILLHACNGVLIFLLVRRFSQNAPLGFACGALFVVHPIHTQAVTYISGRADPLCAFFLLLTVWFYGQARETTGGRRALWLGLALVNFIGALCSKEFAVLLPVLLLAWELVLPASASSRTDHKRWLRLLPFVVLVAAYIFLRRNVFGATAPPDVSGRGEFTPLVLCLRAMACYFSLLLAPLNLHMEQTVAIYGWKGTQLTVTGIFVFASLATLIAMYWRRSRMVAFALLWFVLFFLPVSNLKPLNATLAEHWMYFPSIGLIWAMCAIVDDLLSRKQQILGQHGLQFATTIAVFLILAYAGRTILRNPDWRNEIVFYSRTILAGGGTARVHNNLGMALLIQRNDFTAAEREYEEALKVDPKYDPAMNNLGLLYLQKKDFARAIQLFQQTLQCRPWRVEAYVNLAAAYGDAGMFDQALQQFQEAADKFPKSTLVAFRYGLFALRNGKLDLAGRELRRGQQLNPDSADFANALGGLAIQLDRSEEAVAYLNQAKQLDRNNTNPYLNLAYFYQKQTRFAEAERELLGAVRIEPNNPEFQYRLGVLYWRAGQNHDAARALGKALELYPNFTVALETLEKVKDGVAYGESATQSAIGLKLPNPAAAN